MKKSKAKKPTRKKRTRAEAKVRQQKYTPTHEPFDFPLSPSAELFDRHLRDATRNHWGDEDSDDRGVYEWVLNNAVDDDSASLVPVPITKLEEIAEEYRRDYDPDDPDSFPPLQEPLEAIVGRLVERNLITFDSGTGTITVVPLPEPTSV